MANQKRFPRALKNWLTLDSNRTLIWHCLIPLPTFTFPRYLTALQPSLHRDPDHWDEPDKFKPERFLDQEGRLVRHERFLPFGVGNDPRLSFKMLVTWSLSWTNIYICVLNISSFKPGKRHCIGESLARDELFLIFTRLIQASCSQKALAPIHKYGATCLKW